MKSRIVVKAVTISLMIAGVLTLIVTVVLNYMGFFTLNVLHYHMSAGLLLLSIIPIHVYMMRQKLKKLSDQIYIMSVTGEYRSTCSTQILPAILKKSSLIEFCRFVGIDIDTVSANLMLNQIHVDDPKMSIEQIADENRIDSSRFFSIMLEGYGWGSLPISQPEKRFESFKLSYNV